MSRHEEAMKVLSEYRNALAERLVDTIIENKFDLMEEAEGVDLGFTNNLHDLAEKLRVVNLTISMLPTPPAPPPRDEEIFGTPKQAPPSVVVVSPQITLSDFLQLIEVDEYARAWQVLSFVFGIPIETAINCTEHFLIALKDEDETLSKLARLVQTTSMAESLSLMNELFGLAPSTAQRAMYHWKGT